MTMLPRVTIAMPAYNEEAHLEACLASIQAQDYPAALIEILVAEGRSTDGTHAVLARLAGLVWLLSWPAGWRQRSRISAPPIRRIAIRDQ